MSTKKISKSVPSKGKSPAGVFAKPQATPKQIRRDIREILLTKLGK